MTALPADLDALVTDLRSCDPAVRDDGAYAALARRAQEGGLDDHLVPLGDRGLALLTDAAVQARSFGALLLALVTSRDNATGRATDDAVQGWLRGITRWYAGEPDTRGHDAELGWLHAVAHGADAVGELAGSPRVRSDGLRALLDVLVRRATAATDTHWLQDEDDRVALAVMAVLQRDVLGDDDVRAAVDGLAVAWRSAGPGPVTASVDNAVRLARTLHLQLVLGVRTEPGAEVAHPKVRGAALHALGTALAEMHWFYGRPA